MDCVMNAILSLYQQSSPGDRYQIWKRVEQLKNCLELQRNINDAAERERCHVQRRNNFDEKKCRAYKQLEDLGLLKRNHSALLSIAQVIAAHHKLNIDRESKRRKKLLIKWYDDNFDVVFPALAELELEFTDAAEDEQDDAE